MGPEQVNATQLRDSRNTLAMVLASTHSDQSCMVGLTHNLEVEIFGEEMPVISVITFQNNLAVMFSIDNTRKQNLISSGV